MSRTADADADGVVDSLPAGIDTVPGREFAGGVELSGGQWQKIAVARALAAGPRCWCATSRPRTSTSARRRYPALLVLDEPSASMDTAAEHARYERFSRAGEIGSHDELMALGGVHADLFELQAKGYRWRRRDRTSPEWAGREGQTSHTDGVFGRPGAGKPGLGWARRPLADPRKVYGWRGTTT